MQNTVLIIFFLGGGGIHCAFVYKFFFGGGHTLRVCLLKFAKGGYMNFKLKFNLDTVCKQTQHLTLNLMYFKTYWEVGKKAAAKKSMKKL